MDRKELSEALTKIREDAEQAARKLQAQYVAEHCPFHEGEKIITPAGRPAYFGGIKFSNAFSDNHYVYGYLPKKDGKPSMKETILMFLFYDNDIYKIKKLKRNI